MKYRKLKKKPLSKALNPPLPKGKVLTKCTLTKADYVEMLDRAERHPILMRVAAELWRHGVRLNEFEAGYHLTDFSPSKVVHGHLTDFYFKKGVDPAKVGPYLPQYIELASTTARKLIPPGRPTTEKADVVLRSLEKLCVSAGWSQADFESALSRYITKSEEMVPVMKMAALILDDEDDLPKSKEVAKRNEGRKPVCAACGYKITDRFVAYRGENGPDAFHLNCYWLHKASPLDIAPGTTVFNLKDGQSYAWNAEKSCWKLAKPAPAKRDDGPAGNVSPAEVSVPAPTGGAMSPMPAPSNAPAGKSAEVSKPLPASTGVQRQSASKKASAKA
jgi:hypothetical protein